MKTTKLFSRNILSSLSASVMAIAFAAATVLTASSCTKESVQSGKTNSGLTFSASLGEETKTTLYGAKVLWNLGDKVSLWFGTLETEMQTAEYFVGAVNKDDARKAALFGFAEESADYIAVYPQSAVSECSAKGKLTLTVPTVQTLTPDNFAPEANISVAYSQTTELSFKNVGGLMAIQVPHTGHHTIKDIRLAGTEALTGNVEMKKKDIPSVTEIKDGVNYATLHCEEGLIEAIGFPGTNEGFTTQDGSWTAAEAGVTLVGGTEPSKAIAGVTFYLVTLPGSHKNFSITLVDDQGRTAVAKSTNFFTIERNGNTLIAKINAPSGEWPAAPKVFINEIHTHNNQIELWNPNDFSVDLTGWLLVKDEKSWAFPVGSSIPANSYKVITAGQTEGCADGPMFGISGDKGFILSLVSGSTVDCIDNSGDDKKVIGETETFGRRTDGSDEWVIFSKGTIYEEGVCDGDNSKGTVKGDEPVTATVVLNEINGNDKYAELYNYGSKDADITGWMLEKDGKTVWTATDASQCTIAAGGYLAIDFVSKSTDPKEASSGISAKKNLKLALQDASGNDVDVFKRGEKGEGWGETTLPENKTNSFSRTPDGTGAWKYAAPTKGTANGPATGTIEQYPAANGSVVLNELDGNSKFIELYNTSTDWPISLEDVTLYKDDDETEVIWTGAPGYAVAPGGYVLLYSEDVIGSHPEHNAGLVFTSGLSPKKTLKIELRDAAGTSLDIFTRGEKGEGWGAKISECTDSYGRVADGIGAWYLTQSTPGAANVATTDPPTAIPQK